MRQELLGNQTKELEEVQKVYEEEMAKFKVLWDQRECMPACKHTYRPWPALNIGQPSGVDSREHDIQTLVTYRPWSHTDLGHIQTLASAESPAVKSPSVLHAAAAYFAAHVDAAFLRVCVCVCV